ncbi:MAG: hypothetical protein AAGF50_13510 [Pseudomonadota bacterium]
MRRSTLTSIPLRLRAKSWRVTSPNADASGNRDNRKPHVTIFPFDTSIHNRPDTINDRRKFGNWEGDLMIFERVQRAANVDTLIERKTRNTVLLRSNDRKSRPLVNRLINDTSPLPSQESVVL